MKERQDISQSIELRARPKDKLVEVGKTEIKIKQQVHFATGKADILPDSFPMLNEIAQLLKVNPCIKTISIEG